MSWAIFAEEGIFKEIKDFLKTAHEVDERHAQEESKEFDEDLENAVKVGHKALKAEEEYEKADDDERMERGRTLAEIRHGLNKRFEEHEIEAALKQNEDEVAHWPHPEGKRFTLAEHIESNHYAHDFIPGVG